MSSEHLLVRTRAHTAVLARPLGAALIAVSVLALVVAVLVRAGHPGLLGQVVGVVAAIVALRSLLRLVRRVWEWDRTQLVVTDEQLVIERRGLRRQDHIVPLAAVHRLRVRRSVPGRLLGYGTIEIAGPRRGSRIAFVPRPDDVSAVIAAYAGRHHDLR